MYTDLKSSAVAVIAGLAATASAITGPGDFCYGNYFSMYNRGGPSVSYQRVDPALNPGVQAPHLHSFDGGNNIKSTMSTSDLQASTCTTNKFKQDKSLYWNPTLHFQNDTGFYRVPEMFKKVYYKFGEGSNNIKASGFPKDFMMIAGNTQARSKDDMPAEAGISWSCMYDGGRIDMPGFPTGRDSCSQGFATQLTFPSCWNGETINPAEPHAHMAYPTGGIGTDGCPAGFQVKRFPAIFIEFWWDIKQFAGTFGANDSPWVLSNGDPTGFGFHADFANGWDDGVLEKTISDNAGLKCGCGCGDDEFNAYFGAAQVNSGTEWDSCTATNEYPGEDLEFMSQLPGCNPLQYGPAAATAGTGEGCAAAPKPSATATKASTSAAATPSAVSSAVSSALDAASSYLSKATSILAAASPSATFLSISLPGKPVEDVSTSAPAAASSSSFVFLSGAGASTVAAASSYVAVSSAAEVPVPSSSAGTEFNAATTIPASSPSEGVCNAPVYVTITPTVTVTAGPTGGSCGETIYRTVTNTATVTVAPTKGSAGYMHRRHLEAHLHKH